MVEVSEGKAKPKPLAADAGVRERLQKLTEELDTLERAHQRVCGAFRAAVGALAGMGPSDLPEAAMAAVAAVRKAAGASPVEADVLEQAVGGLRNALLLIPPPSAGAAAPTAGAEASPSQAGAHVALALLEGLRLGQPEFDAHLEKAINEINKLIAAGQVRPAMSVLVDLLDHYRFEHSRRWAKAETALKEVLSELLSTESEFTEAVAVAQNQLARSGQDFEESMTGAMGRMAQDISQAGDLDTLKIKALEHIRGLRDNIRAKRSQEKAVLERTQGEIDRLRTTLNSTRARMQQVEKVSQALSQEAMTDPLTKALNKRALTNYLEQALAGTADWPLCLIVFDIDHFKGINDNFGHQAGDRALKAITQQAGTSLRSQDTLFRYAGDEFVVLLRQTALNDGRQVAERVRQAAESIKFTYRGQSELKITVSLGVAQAKQGDTAESLFERADQALYNAKRSGRNQVASA